MQFVCACAILISKQQHTVELIIARNLNSPLKTVWRQKILFRSVIEMCFNCVCFCENCLTAFHTKKMGTVFV